MLIGLCGAAGCGKTTLANQMTEDGYELYGFADPIKDMLKVFGIDRADWDDREFKEAPLEWIGVSPRYLAQTLGTEWGRHCINPNIWVALAGIQWQRCQILGMGDFLVTDVRFENEAQWIHDEGGFILQIVRKTIEHAVDNPSHPSEAGLSAKFVDAIVYNDSSIEHLRVNAWSAINSELDRRSQK